METRGMPIRIVSYALILFTSTLCGFSDSLS